MDNLKELDSSLEVYNLPRWNQETENYKQEGWVIIIIKKTLWKERLRQNSQSFCKLFQKPEEEKALPKSFCKPCIILCLNQAGHYKKNLIHKSVCMMSIWEKGAQRNRLCVYLNRLIWSSRSCTNIYHHCSFSLFPGSFTLPNRMSHRHHNSPFFCLKISC